MHGYTERIALGSTGKPSMILPLYAHAWNFIERLAHRRKALQETQRKLLGNSGERQAYFYLRRAGYTVVARQWRAPNLNGELDLIAWHGETLCFVEVKTRSAGDRYAPGYRMNPKKCEVLRRMARAYVHGLPWRGDTLSSPLIRFDLVSVLHHEGAWSIDHLQNVFPAV